MEKFTIDEIRKYIESQDSMGDILYNLSVKKINEANESKCECDIFIESHSCPFQEDVHGDNSDFCNCCSECEHQCAMDI